MEKKDWEQRLSIDKELRILWKLCLGLEENVKSVKKYVKRVETARYQQKNTQPQAEEKTKLVMPPSAYEQAEKEGFNMKNKVKSELLPKSTPEQKEEWVEMLDNSLKSMKLGMSGSQRDWIYNFIKNLLSEREREVLRGLLDDHYDPNSDSIEIDVSEIQSELSKLTTK